MTNIYSRRWTKAGPGRRSKKNWAKAKWIVGLVCVLLIVLFIFAALVGFVIWLLPVILIVVGISWILRRLNGR